MTTNPNDLGKSPTQQKTDILTEYQEKGGSILINSNRRITVDGIKGGKVLYYIAGSDASEISISSITEIKDYKTGEKLFPKE